MHPSTAADVGLITVSSDPNRFINDKQAAELVGLSRSYLRTLRVKGGGCVYYTPGGGRAVRYKVADLIAWVESAAKTSTSQG
ncbi:MAG: helix-turn-helix transcriptional regulator [Caulobacterales bacterium]